MDLKTHSTLTNECDLNLSTPVKRSLQSSILDGLSVVFELLVLLINLAVAAIEALAKLLMPTPEKELKGEVVLVTGTGHGIGRELALRLAGEGCTVIAWDVNEEGNAETYKIAKEMNLEKNIHVYKCDVSNRDEVHSLAEKVTKEIGDVTIVVNNAGVMTIKRMEDHGCNAIKKTFDVNVLSHFWVLEAFLPKMKERKSGHIVAICSMCGVMGMSYLVPYCSSKFAVRGLMEGLHHELRNDPEGKHIKLTTIYPIQVASGMVKKIKIRFPSVLPYLTVETTVDHIMTAIKRETQDASIPSSHLATGKIMSLIPRKCSDLIINFLDTGVIPD